HENSESAGWFFGVHPQFLRAANELRWKKPKPDFFVLDEIVLASDPIWSEEGRAVTIPGQPQTDFQGPEHEQRKQDSRY
ncbi:MAG: hypothetical protein ACXWBP_01025, partial [Limisphaerales bacterium]